MYPILNFAQYYKMQQEGLQTRRKIFYGTQRQNESINNKTSFLALREIHRVGCSWHTICYISIGDFAEVKKVVSHQNTSGLDNNNGKTFIKLYLYLKIQMILRWKKKSRFFFQFR